MATIHPFPLKEPEVAKRHYRAAQGNLDEAIRVIDKLLADVEATQRREKQTRTIKCTIGFLAANWFAASLVTCICLYFAAEVLGR